MTNISRDLSSVLCFIREKFLKYRKLSMPQGHKNTGKTPAKALFHAAWLAGMGLALSGCLAGPDYQAAPVTMPGHWSNAASQKVQAQPAALAGWWRQLQDPLLDKLVAKAIAGNTDVATAKARVREARATLRQTTGTLLPSLGGAADARRSRTGTAPETSRFNTGLDAGWEIDLFGANRRAVEAASYGLDANIEELRATMVTLIGDIADNYIEARGQQAKIALARQSAASQRRTANLTKDKFTAGAVSALDVNNADGQAASTEASIPQMERQLAAAIHRLSVLTGNAPSALQQEMQKVKPVPRPKWPLPAGVPADILFTRPDIRVAERRYAQSTARIGQREAERYPAFSLTGTINTAAAQIGDLGRSSTINWATASGLSIPIFQGGQRLAAVEAARAQRDQTFIAYRASILTALEEVENALVALNKDRIRSTKLGQAATSYGKALELSRDLYQSGNTSFLELLTAERSHFSAQQSYVDSRVAMTRDYIALMKALGGGWDGTVDAGRREVVDRNTAPHLRNASTAPTPIRIEKGR
ncbi:MAG: NodT family efflux transporter, outer membrane factor (OMF) lipoprotein [Candidatus Tokpelaia hoelldobleri]|uniref:NodT family efflux transporter, outer membrane factor (OMF) lipoprotein n=1 Tax=Candidatus Tokpelaia hoelldobleri TaxID=1902579 RepID=A0A1U9JWK4_9HYPH|nr:MAG: NodT family efflux transporter, outer membrane factor (OMF) lipoprotein [Candidatus Tokpelaia hoelldoblerii]